MGLRAPQDDILCAGWSANFRALPGSFTNRSGRPTLSKASEIFSAKALPPSCNSEAAFRAQKKTNNKECFLEMGFDVLPAVPGRRTAFHDCFPRGLNRFFRRSGISGKSLYAPLLYVPLWRLMFGARSPLAAAGEGRHRQLRHPQLSQAPFRQPGVAGPGTL